jgi:hypothetical protein
LKSNIFKVIRCRARRFDQQGFGDDTRRISWDDVSVVGIRTSSEGPFREGVFWQFLLRGGLSWSYQGR